MVREKGTDCENSMGGGSGLEWSSGGRTYKPDLDPRTFIQEPNDDYFTDIPDGTFDDPDVVYGTPEEIANPCSEVFDGVNYRPTSWCPVSELSGQTCGVTTPNVAGFCDDQSSALNNSSYLTNPEAIYTCNGANGKPYMRVTEYSYLQKSSQFAFNDTDPRFTLFFVFGNLEARDGCVVTMDNGTGSKNNMGVYRHQIGSDWYVGFNDYDYDQNKYILYQGVKVNPTETVILRFDISDSGLLITKNAGQEIYSTNLMDIPFRFRSAYFNKYWGGSLVAGSPTGTMDYYEYMILSEYNGKYPAMTEVKVRAIEEYLAGKFAVPIPTTTISYPEFIHTYYYKVN
jgi:hypothetical protein